MAETFVAKQSTRTPPPPPRLTGNFDVDIIALRDWFAAFVEVAVVETGLLDPSYQASGGANIDLDALPDPEATTIARAQATANAIQTAYKSQFPLPSGRFTISGVSDTAEVDFAAPLAFGDFDVIITPRTYEGAPTVDAFIVIQVVTNASGFSVVVNDAPGAGAAVTYSYLVTHNEGQS